MSIQNILDNLTLVWLHSTAVDTIVILRNISVLWLTLRHQLCLISLATFLDFSQGDCEFHRGMQNNTGGSFNCKLFAVLRLNAVFHILFHKCLYIVSGCKRPLCRECSHFFVKKQIMISISNDEENDGNQWSMVCCSILDMHHATCCFTGYLSDHVRWSYVCRFRYSFENYNLFREQI